MWLQQNLDILSSSLSLQQSTEGTVVLTADYVHTEFLGLDFVTISDEMWISGNVKKWVDLQYIERETSADEDGGHFPYRILRTITQRLLDIQTEKMFFLFSWRRNKTLRTCPLFIALCYLP